MNPAHTPRPRITRRHEPTVRVSRLRLVFGPAATPAEVFHAFAEALDPLDIAPRHFECSHDADGYRLRVTCELDPSRPDLGHVLARLLRRRSREPGLDRAPVVHPRSAA
jgi:hypothetical protein